MTKDEDIKEINVVVEQYNLHKKAIDEQREKEIEAAINLLNTRLKDIFKRFGWEKL